MSERETHREGEREREREKEREREREREGGRNQCVAKQCLKYRDVNKIVFVTLNVCVLYGGLFVKKGLYVST